MQNAAREAQECRHCDFRRHAVLERHARRAPIGRSWTGEVAARPPRTIHRSRRMRERDTPPLVHQSGRAGIRARETSAHAFPDARSSGSRAFSDRQFRSSSTLLPNSRRRRFEVRMRMTRNARTWRSRSLTVAGAAQASSTITTCSPVSRLTMTSSVTAPEAEAPVRAHG